MEKVFKKVGLSSSISGSKVRNARKLLQNFKIFVKGNFGCVWIIKLSSCGRFLATVDAKKVYVWDIVKGRIRSVMKFQKNILGLEFNANELDIYVILIDGSVFLQKIKTGYKEFVVKFESTSNLKIFAVTKAEQLITIGISGEIFLFDIKTKVLEKFQSITDMYIKALTAARLTNTVYFAIVNEIVCWNAQESKTEYKLAGHSKGITCLALSKNEESLISASIDLTLIVWDLKTQTQVFQSIQAYTIFYVIWSHSQKYYISSDKTIKLWDTQTNSVISVLINNSSVAISLALTPDDSILITGATDGSIYLWDIRSKTRLSVLKNDGKIKKLLFCEGFQSLLSLGISGKVLVWNLKEKKTCKTLSENSFIKDICCVWQDKVALVLGDGNVDIFQISSWERVQVLQPNYECIRIMNSLIGTAFCICELNKVHFWADFTRPVYSQESKLPEIHSVSSTKSNKYFVICQASNACEVWIL